MVSAVCNLLISVEIPHQILAVENCCHSILGYSPSQLVGSSFQIIQGPASDSLLIHHAITTACQNRSASQFHISLYAADGQCLEVLFNCYPFGSDSCKVSLARSIAIELAEPTKWTASLSSVAGVSVQQPLSTTPIEPNPRSFEARAPAARGRRGVRAFPSPLLVDDGYVRRLRRRLRSEARRKAAAPLASAGSSSCSPDSESPPPPQPKAPTAPPPSPPAVRASPRSRGRPSSRPPRDMPAAAAAAAFAGPDAAVSADISSRHLWSCPEPPAGFEPACRSGISGWWAGGPGLPDDSDCLAGSPWPCGPPSPFPPDSPAAAADDWLVGWAGEPDGLAGAAPLPEPAAAAAIPEQWLLGI